MLLSPTVTILNQRPLFSPLSLPGLAAWYDASDSSTVLTTVSPDVPATDGQTVRRWLDKSGNGRHLEQANIVQQPTLTGGGLDSLGTQFMQASFAVIEPQTHYFAAIDLGASDNTRILDGGTGNRCMFRKLTNQLNAFTGSTNLSATGAITSRFIGGAVFASAGAGVFHNLTFNGGTLSNGATDAFGLTILANPGGTSGFAGTLFERFSYNAAHDAETRERVIRWLARKWGITV
jgi:hypothetical protein